jgi:Fe2+ transport system protein FeoA
VASPHLLPLELIEAGGWAEVEDIDGEPTWISRLAELGVRVGSRLQVIRQGRPCLLRIGGCRLSLRDESGMQILVRPLPVVP